MMLDDKDLAIVALNGIPRGVCHDFNVEEGWVQYLVPKSGKHADYSVLDAELEARRYRGKVEVLGYWDPNGTADQLRKYYDDLPESTSLLPLEAYEVVESPISPSSENHRG